MYYGMCLEMLYISVERMKITPSKRATPRNVLHSYNSVATILWLYKALCAHRLLILFHPKIKLIAGHSLNQLWKRTVIYVLSILLQETEKQVHAEGLWLAAYWYDLNGCFLLWGREILNTWDMYHTHSIFSYAPKYPAGSTHTLEPEGLVPIANYGLGVHQTPAVF